MIETWESCYDKGWKGLICDEAFRHPAKFSRALIERIYDWLLASGRLKKGDTVIDPFGGVGLGGVIGASKGLRWLGCELELPFVDLARQNFELHRKVWEAAGDPLPVIVQGDSRRLIEFIGPALAASIVSSPPYNLPMSQDHNGSKGGKRGTEPSEVGAFAKYGSTPGQLEGLPMGDVDGVISSPPYAGNVKSDYLLSDDGKTRSRDERRGFEQGKGCFRGSETYGDTPGQLGRLESGTIDGVISSPPYEGSIDGHGDSRHHQSGPDGVMSRARAGRTCQAMSYAGQPDNLGNEVGETFWSASKLIVLQCHAMLRLGGTCVWVVKDFVRHGQRVTFSDDWQRLCEACGFRMVQRVHATLVRETTTNTMFDGAVKKQRSKKSFFRRLAEKRGAPPIDWEDIFVMEKV